LLTSVIEMETQQISVDVEVQNPNEMKSLPSLSDIRTWCEASIQKDSTNKAFENKLSVLIRVVNEAESAELNLQYRDKQGPTNVLSYPNEVPDFMFEIAELKEQNSHMGDLVICEPLVNSEALEQKKSVKSHWAHLIVHGVLHLQGFDHVDEKEAEEMESLEIKIMEQLGFSNPYTQLS